ncbi:MAG: hypothetical protein GXP29_07530 [Planctomycetes bacterium]|nr:hypothetical protein [Planctomycetota bacterium]
MEIEIGKLSQGLTVSEHIVRSIPDPCEGESTSKTLHLQAKIHHQRGHRPPSLLCDVAYISAEEGFLGMDNFDTQYLGAWRDDFLPLNMPLHIPDGATSATLTISVRRGGGFWGLAGKTTTVLLIVLLATWTIKMIATW